MTTNNNNNNVIAGPTGSYYVEGFLNYQQLNYIQTGNAFVNKLGWDTIFVDPTPSVSGLNNSWKVKATPDIESSLAFASATQLNDLFLDTVDPSTWSSDKRRLLQTLRYEDSTGKHIKLVETNMKIRTTPTSDDKGPSCCITKNTASGTGGYLFINGKCVIDQNLDKNDPTGPTFNNININSGVFVNNQFKYGDSTNQITMNKNGELLLTGTSKMTLNNNSINRISLSCFEGADQNALVTQNAVYIYGESKRSGTGPIPGGPMGVQGPQGIPISPQGFQGIMQVGPQGFQGPQGYKGFDADDNLGGPQGPQGITPTGVQGPQGYQGGIGPQGVMGQYQGPQGVTGQNGTNSTVVGPQGFAGVKGFFGAQGVQGNTGISSIIKGSQGAIGRQGITGSTGPDGPNGGARGPQGFVGSSGFRGIQGTTGFRGLMGDFGVQGITGVMGYAKTGNTGINGYMGATGARGFQGVNNVTGFQGFQGSRGFFGFVGQTGATGFQGIQGSQGIECTETGLHAPIGNNNSVNFGGNDNVRFYFYRDAGLTDLTSCTGVIRYMSGVYQTAFNTHTTISWRDMWTRDPTKPNDQRVYGSISGVLSNYLQVISTAGVCYEPILIQIGTGSNYMTGKMMFKNDGVSDIIMEIQPDVVGGFTGNELHIYGGSASFTSVPT